MKQKIKIASRRPTPKDMSRTHYTTLGFGVPFPIFAEETITKDKFRMKVSNFSRLAPMYLPNLGTLQLKLHAFYVPFRLVWNHFENFREGLPSWNSSGAHVYKTVPLINEFVLTDLFIKNSSGQYQMVREITNSDAHDICIDLGSGSPRYKYYRFTRFGKDVYHTLVSLGYNFKFQNTFGTELDVTHNVTFSALPLLCYFKIFLDYFIPSQLQPSSAINYLLNRVHEFNESSMLLSYQDLDQIFGEIRLYYQNNYFTSSWMHPNAPISGLNNIGTTATDRPVINSVTSQDALTANNSRLQTQNLQNTNTGVFPTNNPNNTAATLNNGLISADGLTFMQKFASFIKRSNFAGSRAVERILARFGVHVDDFQIGLCKYLGSETLDLQKSDVTVTGNTAEAGEFVGKGFFSGGSNRVFKCDCDYSGMIFITASLQTPSSYLSGVRRRNLHTKPLDFYTPEFDGSLMQAISGVEVCNRFTTNADDLFASLTQLGLDYNDVYGFSPRYSEYCVPLDSISGDFVVGRLSQNIDAFILPRRLYDENEFYTVFENRAEDNLSLTNFVYNPSYETGAVNPVSDLTSNDSVQFNRIFKDIEGDSDPVFSVFRIDCIVNSVKLPLNESAEIIGRGSEIEFETNGVHLS